MKHTKHPVLKTAHPGYPSVRDARIERRNFLTLIGGVASGALFTSCKQMDENDWLDPAPDGGSETTGNPNENSPPKDNTVESGEIDTHAEDTNFADTDPDSNDTDDVQPVDTGYNSADQISGKMATPELYSVRIPATEGHPVYLSENSYLSYAISTQHENEGFSIFAREKSFEVFAKVDSYLIANTNSDELSDVNSVAQLSLQIQAILEDLFWKESGEEPLFVSVKLVVIHIQKDEMLSGGLA
jgi:hypothetical protein